MTQTIQIDLAGGASVSLPAQAVADALIARLQQSARVEPSQMPAIGDEWPEQGGIYIGSRRTETGLVHVVIPGGTEYDAKGLRWDAAQKHASKFEFNGHSDWVAPSQQDLMLAYINVPHLFKKDSYYWTSTQSGSYTAWALNFEYGFVGSWSKDDEFQVRPFRVINSPI